MNEVVEKHVKAIIHQYHSVDALHVRLTPLETGDLNGIMLKMQEQRKLLLDPKARAEYDTVIRVANGIIASRPSFPTMLVHTPVCMVPVNWTDQITRSAQDNQQMFVWLRDGLLTEQHVEVARASGKMALHFFEPRYSSRRQAHVTTQSFLDFMMTEPNKA